MITATHSPAPFRPSSLRNSTSAPGTPLSIIPMTPPASRPCTPLNLVERPSTPPDSPPLIPLPWLWTCHLCHSSYALGVTRRCIHDGHYFCSGTTVRKDGSTKRHTSCNSEFDYVGWSAWQEWRRETVCPEEEDAKDCWHQCDYPSECRWGQKIGIKSKKSKKLVKKESKIELSCAPAVDHLRSETKDAIVESVVSVVQKKPKTPRSPLREGDEVLAPTSPLKQHYALPTLDDIPEEMDTSWETEDDTPKSIAGTGAISIMLDDARDPDLETDSVESLSPPSIDSLDDDDDSDCSSDSGLSPSEDRFTSQGLDCFDFATAKTVMPGLPVPGISRRAGERKESYDSGYGTDEDEDSCSGDEGHEQFFDVEMEA
ncbi:MAG: hypothetical protein M1837_006071 [Sclerophora amabilis]|nr:MAG: hypothetical protein M1837_006071 [Sclerophora amabilis]